MADGASTASGGNTPTRAMELLLKVYEPGEAEGQDGEAGSDNTSVGTVYYELVFAYRCHCFVEFSACFRDLGNRRYTLRRTRRRKSSRGQYSGGLRNGVRETMEGLFDTAFAHLQNALMEAKVQGGVLNASSELVVLRVLSLLSMAIT